MIEPGMAALILFLGFTVSCLSGFLGIGGGIVMAPALLYLLPLFGGGALDMREVTGLTITQGLFACLSGAIRHDKHRCVNRRLVAWMGPTVVVSALAGAVASRWVSNEALLVIFAGLAMVAALLMLLPKVEGSVAKDPSEASFSIPLALAIALVVGVLGGMVGQGGSFILIPLMLYVLCLPTRAAIGSNLVIVFLASLAAFLGKLAAGMIPLLPAILLAAAAIPGAQVGSVLSQRTSPRWLRKILAVVVAIGAAGIAADAFAGG